MLSTHSDFPDSSSMSYCLEIVTITITKDIEVFFFFSKIIWEEILQGRSVGKGAGSQT